MNASKLTGQCVSGIFDPDVPSDGLTLDTICGPIDLVAVQYAMSGRPVALTPAERQYVTARTRSAANLRATAAAGFGLIERRAVAA